MYRAAILHRLVCGLVLSIVYPTTFAEAAPTVSIAPGKINGIPCASTSSNAYLSIPFALPPLGSLRFAPPEAYNASYPSTGLNATTKPKACIQFGNQLLEPPPWSEDCLYLNVWTPSNSTSTSRLPVKFWIYGGSDNAGGTADPLYDGCNLAGMGDQVVVSANYRLGALGFMVAEEAGIYGNMGVQDLLLALRWVQDNIGAFGGDPDNVLTFGQSAGAGLTWILSALDEAPSLMRAAIAESGAGSTRPTTSIMEGLAAQFASGLNCSVSDAQCFRSKTPAQLNASLPHSSDPLDLGDTSKFQPYVDGKIIPVDPLEVGSKVPLIAGATSMEGTLFVLGSVGNPQNLSQQDYTNFLQANFGNLTTQIEQRYPVSAFNSTPIPVFEAMSEVYSLVGYICPARRALRATIQHGVPAWTYRFEHQPTCGWAPDINSQNTLNILGATHTSDIPFVFSHLTDLPPPNGSCSFNAAEQRISRALVSSWTSMASQGNPDRASDIIGGPWPQYDDTRSRGLLVVNSTTVGVVNYTQCDFWDQVNAEIVAPWGGDSGVEDATSSTSTNMTTTTSSLPQFTGGVAATSASLGLAVVAATLALLTSM